ncbi:MAG: NUDIX domain-containing protein [Pseudomonadota bacterium]|nr:NUDIX domain-containing protein [Pseudomonadota bacterium]
MLQLDRLLPARLHRLGMPFAHAVRIRWWRLRRPLVVSCLVLAVNPAGEVLLVRHSYGARRWMLPSGGMARGETPIAAAKRELSEETACTLTAAIEIAVTHKIVHGATNIVHVIAGRASGVPRPDRREIVDACYFAPGALPHDISGSLARNLPGWLGQIPRAEA